MDRRAEVEIKASDGAKNGTDQRKRLYHQLASKETDFLRLRRVRLGVSDFATVKVIGKGAFGEARGCLWWSINDDGCRCAWSKSPIRARFTP